MILDGGAKAYFKYQVIYKDHIHFITTQGQLWSGNWKIEPNSLVLVGILILT